MSLRVPPNVTSMVLPSPRHAPPTQLCNSGTDAFTPELDEPSPLSSADKRFALHNAAAYPMSVFHRR